MERLEGIVPVGACIDTCHTHVAGYDIVSEEGMYKTLQHLDATIGLNRVRCGTAMTPRLRRDRNSIVTSTWEGNHRERSLSAFAE